MYDYIWVLFFFEAYYEIVTASQKEHRRSRTDRHRQQPLLILRDLNRGKLYATFYLSDLGWSDLIKNLSHIVTHNEDAEEMSAKDSFTLYNQLLYHPKAPWATAP